MMETGMDDREIDRLEVRRRHGYHGQDYQDENEYFSLPPTSNDLLQDWATWRSDTNTGLLKTVFRSDGRDGEFRDILTSPPEMKAPRFFRGAHGAFGRRTKDHYGAASITESDDAVTRMMMEIKDENFFLFGIPRVSLKRSSAINKESTQNTKGNDKIRPSRHKSFGNRLPRTMLDEDERGYVREEMIPRDRSRHAREEMIPRDRSRHAREEMIPRERSRHIRRY